MNIRVNLLLDSPNGVRVNYINIDPFSKEGDTSRICAPVSNLSSIVDQGEAEEIIAENVIDYLGPNRIDSAVVDWISRLKHGGILTVGGTDLRALTKAFTYRQIELTETNTILFGEQTNDTKIKKSCLTPQHLVNMLKSEGMKILEVRFSNFRYVVKAERP